MAKKTIKAANKQPVANSDQSTNFEVANCDLKTMRIESLIRFIREKQVILDTDLAMLYGVETRRLNEQVRRNIERFPEDFMFQLTKDEVLSSRSQYCDLEEWPSSWRTTSSRRLVKNLIWQRMMFM